MLSNISQYFLKKEIVNARVKRIESGTRSVEYNILDPTTPIVPNVPYKHLLVDVNGKEIELSECPSNIKENDEVQIVRSKILNLFNTDYSLKS